MATSTTLSHHHFPYFASSAGTTLNPQANKAKLLYFQCYFLNYLWYSQPPRIECWVGTTHCQLDKGQDNGVEFCGGGSPGCPEVIARYARTGEPLAYIEASTPKRRSLDARDNSHSRLQARYSSRFLLPTHHPYPSHGALIVS